MNNALPVLNSDQLAFILLSKKYLSVDYSKFAIKCHDDKWYYLQNDWIVYSDINANNIKPNKLLNRQYDDLQDKISLNDLEAFYYGENESDLIAPKFLLVS